MTDSAQPAIAFSAAIDSLAAELYKKSRGERFGITRQEFASILGEVGRKYLPAVADEAADRELYLNLRVEDLVTPRACACGTDHAWKTFLLRYREQLYDSDQHIS